MISVKRGMFFCFLFFSLFLSCSREIRSIERADFGFDFYLFADFNGKKYQLKGVSRFVSDQLFVLNLYDTLIQKRVATIDADINGRIFVYNFLSKEVWVFQDPKAAKFLISDWPHRLKKNSNQVFRVKKANRVFEGSVLKRFPNGSVRRFEIKLDRNRLIFDILRYGGGNLERVSDKKAFKRFYLKDFSVKYLSGVFDGS